VGRDPVEEWRRRLTSVAVNGIRTFVLDEGIGDPIVCLHGIPTQAFLWRDVARVLARGHRVVAPDLPGFGFADRSPSMDLTPMGQATFVQQLLDDLGIQEFALVMHDYGALVGMELLDRNSGRVTHVVVTNTSLSKRDWGGGRLTPYSLLKVRGIGEAAFRLARPFMLTQAFRIYTAEKRRLTSDVMDVFWHPFEHGVADTLLRLARDRRLTNDDFYRWRSAAWEYDGPALIAWGGLDPTFRVEQGRSIAHLFPRGHFELFDDANHFIQLDRPDALGRLIRDFLAGRVPVPDPSTWE
jgi:pimeloyl-ACP methyl ester carboxylesterase